MLAQNALVSIYDVQIFLEKPLINNLPLRALRRHIDILGL